MATQLRKAARRLHFAGIFVAVRRPFQQCQLWHTNQPWGRRMPLNVKRDVSSGVMLFDLSLIQWTRGKSAVQFEWAKIELKSHVIRTQLLD
jgi:hypothetical protein